MVYSKYYLIQISKLPYCHRKLIIKSGQKSQNHDSSNKLPITHNRLKYNFYLTIQEVTSHQIIQDISNFLATFRLLFATTGFNLLGIGSTTAWWQVCIIQAQKLFPDLRMISTSWRGNRKGSWCIGDITTWNDFRQWKSEASGDQSWTD